MHFKGKYSCLKHLDFILLDLISFTGAFVISCWQKFDDFNVLRRARLEESVPDCTAVAHHQSSNQPIFRDFLAAFL